MFRRVDDIGFQISLKKESYYLDKFVLFPDDKYLFATFEDLVKFVDISFSLLNKTNITGEIKEYMLKILSSINSLKSLQLKLNSGYDMSKGNIKYNKGEYQAQLQNVINNMYKAAEFKEELVSILDTKEITQDEYDVYTYDETNKERNDREKEGKKKPSPDNVSYAAYKENALMIIFPEKLIKKYNNYICSFVEVKTGDFYTDLFTMLITEYDGIKPSKNTSIQNDITEQQVQINIAITLDILVQTLIYLKNSTSFRDNKLYYFDEFEIDTRMGYALSLLKAGMERLTTVL